MKYTKKIGWQKYEDMIQNQLQSPLIEAMYQSLSGQSSEIDLDDLSEDEQEILNSLRENEQEDPYGQYVIPVDPKMMEHINLSANFDCWLGHTNFNITKDVLDTLESMEGVEVLKVCSRYRFFVGIGRMFDFSEVRQNIEDTLTTFQEKEIEQEN
jgi:hypothetical protein|tara:strand:+ start:1641 stop:2105 length:465 start_codon:yes stop_codon:yes gene_type:complete